MWLLVLVVCGTAVLLGPVWTKIAEHATLADLVSSNREHLGRVYSCDGSCRMYAFTCCIPSSTNTDNSILLLI